MIPKSLLKKYNAKLVKLKKNETIFQAGDAATNFFVVKSGKIKMATYSGDGREFVQGYFVEGQSFGEPPFFNHIFIATVSKRKSRAFGIALALWFFFVLFYDLLSLGGSLMFKGQSANTFLFLSLFGNPVDMVRVATLILLDNVTIFGAAGAAMMRFLGGAPASVGLLVLGLLTWTWAPLLLSARLIRRQDL